jgi:hypothetical protein
MNPTDRRLQLDLAAARYLAALERDDFTAMADIWRLALADPELEAVLREVHTGLIEEQAGEATAAAAAALAAAVETHLPSAEIVRPSAGAVTVGDVAEELFRHTPDRLPAEAHLLNERLRVSQEPLPEELGLSGLIGWAEKLFGAAPAEYWKAFRQAAVKLELRRGAQAEYHLAARSAPKPEEKS